MSCSAITGLSELSSLVQLVDGSERRSSFVPGYFRVFCFHDSYCFGFVWLHLKQSSLSVQNKIKLLPEYVVDKKSIIGLITISVQFFYKVRNFQQV